MATNRLIHEKSPYLLQHAHNPVDWYAWGEEAFDKAKRENKPIFLSIGYSTCHWCHVMERESFEDEAVAQVLNENFISVKVDREERPDIDRIYMTYVQAATGSGGWPMSVFLTPELTPFFGGTYFPPDNRYGRPGFPSLVAYLGKAWREDREAVVRSGSQAVQQLAAHIEVKGGEVALTDSVFERLYASLKGSYDAKYGGLGHAPKFPRPVVLNYLFRHGKLFNEPEAARMAIHTLKAMAQGGMYDQLGGGFHRYSVDQRWFVPHFEKMLYDQAQLVVSYIEAFQITGDRFFARIASETLEYVLREMTDADGGFYSAEDADSVVDPAHPHEKAEGAFYVWAWDDLVAALGPEKALRFAFYYGCEEDGNVDEDPHQEFTGKNILAETVTVGQAAARFGMTAEAFVEEMAESRQILFARRAERVRPHLDDKILAGWNGLMISALAVAGRVLAHDEFKDAAVRAANFVMERMVSADGILQRRWRDGEAAVDGFLDDYAFLAQGLLDLYEATLDPRWLLAAEHWASKMITRFGDAQTGGFFSTAGDDASLLFRVKDDYDGAEPSGNSIAILTLLRLSSLLDRQEFRDEAERGLEAFSSRLAGASVVTLPQMAVALLWARKPVQQIVLAGETSDETTRAMLASVRQGFYPQSVLLLLDLATRAALGSRGAVWEQMRPAEGRTTAYVCEDFACRVPVSTANEFEALLH